MSLFYSTCSIRAKTTIVHVMRRMMVGYSNFILIPHSLVSIPYTLIS